MPTPHPRQIRQSAKLLNVRYDVRGPILEEAQRMEAAGHRIMKLNIGNPAPFGFEAPDAVLAAMHQHLPHAQGYSDSKGIYSARTAVSQYYESRGIRDIGVDDVFIGNGVSEMITMVLQALVDDGDEILVPSPDYPLWTGATTLAGGRAVHYRCVEEEGWEPDLEHIESLVTERTKGIVLINPNNPTGAVYSDETLRALADVARRHGITLALTRPFEEGLGLAVNGVPVFCRGANWTPPDLVGLGTEDGAILVDLAREAGMNMLRVSGATLYPSPEFYDLCDAAGILATPVETDFAHSGAPCSCPTSPPGSPKTSRL